MTLTTRTRTAIESRLHCSWFSVIRRRQGSAVVFDGYVEGEHVVSLASVWGHAESLRLTLACLYSLNVYDWLGKARYYCLLPVSDRRQAACLARLPGFLGEPDGDKRVRAEILEIFDIDPDEEEGEE